MSASGLFRVLGWVFSALIALSGCIQSLEQAQPLIVLDPAQGGPGTSVAIVGSGFPAEARVSVRLGPPSVGATPTSYGDVDTDSSGSLQLSFTMPSHWPDGTFIAETNLVVVVLNQDGSAKATAAFVYLPSSAGVVGPALGVHETDLATILAWHREGDTDGFCGDVVVYDSGYTEIVACEGGGSIERRQLSKDVVDRLQEWAVDYQAFDIEQIKGTGPGQVRTRTTFAGTGARQVSPSELRIIQSLLEALAPSP